MIDVRKQLQTLKAGSKIVLKVHSGGGTRSGKLDFLLYVNSESILILITNSKLNYRNLIDFRYIKSIKDNAKTLVITTNEETYTISK